MGPLFNKLGPRPRWSLTTLYIYTARNVYELILFNHGASHIYSQVLLQIDELSRGSIFGYEVTNISC